MCITVVLMERGVEYNRASDTHISADVGVSSPKKANFFAVAANKYACRYVFNIHKIGKTY